ncbi:X2-like carbohydrate binding domain-containing protein [Paenibacillus aurantiacus]|uniref:X2-like carbohydrate binding domain-containing protein n=1 Tax=Paenibacillus aurantiacus TaxID=1936118 RepID=A0ABV5L096_9BACL
MGLLTIKRTKNPFYVLVIVSLILNAAAFSSNAYAASNTFTGELVNGDNMFNRCDVYGLDEDTTKVFNSVDLAACTPSSGQYNYFTRDITPTVTGNYTLSVSSATFDTGTDGYGYYDDNTGDGRPAYDDTTMYVYSHFDPARPLDGLLWANDDRAFVGGYSNDNDFKSQLPNIPLTADTTYTVVITSFAAGINGTINSEVTGDGSVIISANAYSADVAASPSANPAGGAVASGTSVALSTATAGASIYYTTDGSMPTASSTLYSAPILVNEAMTVKAIAVKSGLTNSDVMTQSYTIIAPQNSSIAPTTGGFDKNASNQADVATVMTLNGNNLSRIANNGDDLVLGTDYTVSANTVTIKKEYLAQLSTGTATLTLNFSAGSAQTLTITVTDTTPAPPQNSSIAPTTGGFDKNALNQADVATVMTLNGNSLSGFANNGDDLVLGTDYTVSANTVTIKKEYLAQLSTGTATLTLNFSAGSAQTLTITVTDTTPAPPQSGSNSSSSSSSQGNAQLPVVSPAGTTNTGVNILVNGKVEQAGTATTTQSNNQVVITVAVDRKKLEEKLAAEGQGAVVTIPVDTKSDVIVGELNGQMVKNMEQKQAVVEIKTKNATYTLPAQQINIDSISEQIGRAVELQDIKIQIQIATPLSNTLQIVNSAAARDKFALVGLPVNFTVNAAYGDTQLEVSKFNAYVERTIALPEGADATKITTAVVVEPDGTVRHVPTKVVVIDGVYYAKVNSLTNSTYSLVWHPREFADANGHWAKDAINDMGSRMIVNGLEDGSFRPNQDMTRAEFAQMMVRGLGLKLENGKAPFGDINESDWYNEAVKTAAGYELINGFKDGTFRPQDKITREQAMTILARAMKLSGLKDKLQTTNADTLLYPFKDSGDVSAWARSSVTEALQSGIVTGKSNQMLDPQANITRAEVAVMIRNLLSKSGLI